MQPHSPVEQSLRRRGSSSSSQESRFDYGDAQSTLQVMQDEEEEGWQHIMPQAGPLYRPDTTTQHRRGHSSASNADIGLRGIHSRHASSAAGSPLFLQTFNTSHNHPQNNKESINSEADFGGHFDPLSYQDDEIGGPSDAIPLTPGRDRRNWHHFRNDSAGPADAVPAKTRLYDSPVPPLLEDEVGDGDDGRKPNDLESSPETAKSTQSRSKSRRAKGTEVYYSQNSHAPKRRATLIESAKMNIKRMSIRVVNLRQRNEERHVHIEGPASQEDTNEGRHFARLQDIPSDLPDAEADFAEAAVLRGRTLGVFSPENWLRRGAHAVFLWPYVVLC